MAIELPQEFDKARDEASFIEHRQAMLVHNSVQADGVGELNNGGFIDGGAGAAKDMRVAQEKTEKRNADNRDAIMLLASQRLASFEGDLEAQYGENFDLDLLGDLVEQGKFTQDDYAKFASIEDKDDRRKAIAQAIQDKIDAGEIDPTDLKDHAWAGKWLDLHEEATAERDHDKKLALSGQKSEHEIASDAKDEVKYETAQNSTEAGKFEVATEQVEEQNVVDQQAQLSMNVLGV